MLFTNYKKYMEKKLYRSTTYKIVGGVLAGLAEYFGHDRLLWRLGFVVLLLVTGLMPFALVYIIAWMFIPLRPTIEPVDTTQYTVSKDE